MTRGRRHRLIRYTLLFAALVALIGYVASDAVRGPHGLIANQVLRDKIGILQKDLAALKAQRVRLERDADLLGPKAVSQPALVDEQARALLDLARPADIVIVNGDRGGR
jgi:cell division protein FtsB